MVGGRWIVSGYCQVVEFNIGGIESWVSATTMLVNNSSNNNNNNNNFLCIWEITLTFVSYEIQWDCELRTRIFQLYTHICADQQKGLAYIMSPINS
jgi:hypothetical protein